MSKPFKFQLGNRGLLPEELGLAQRVNDTLSASARRHGLTLRHSARIVVHVSYSNGRPTYRAAASGKKPVLVPLASVYGAGQPVSTR